MKDAILVLNAGSSSIKFSLFTTDGIALDLDCKGQIESLFDDPHFIASNPQGNPLSEKHWGKGFQLGHSKALEHLNLFLAQELSHLRLIAAGHRVVHGGTQHWGPIRIDQSVLTTLQALCPLAPLHQPHNLLPIRLLLAQQPELVQIACFDTAFHQGNDELVQTFAIPLELRQAGVRRYGFHGLSYEYIASVLPQYDVQAARGRTIVLHLGNGSSMCALVQGRSVASTMGFTALDGLPMGTRCGAIDPGVLLYLMRERGMNADAIEKLLYTQSGLLGVSGISGDMRTLLASQEPAAEFAIDLYLHRIRREIGSLAAQMGGLDAIVFTAGIGENCAPIRARVMNDSGWLGIRPNQAANRLGGPRISAANSRISAWTIPTNEELMIARHTLKAVRR